MKDDQKERVAFSQIMIGVAENFSAQVSSAGLNLRFVALKEYSLQQIEAAALKILANRKAMGMPTVAEFIVAITGEQKNCDPAENQVNEIMKQIRSVGSYGTPVFSDPITKSLLSSRWTFRSLCAMTEVELKWWGKEFSEAYQSMERSEQRVLIGADSVNARKLKLLTGGIGR
jgi:hypothetical protein